MPIPNDIKLYEQVKYMADKKYKTHSAYKSGYIVKTYKEMGGTYKDDKQPRNLARWFKEELNDVGNSDYPVYRPTKRINKDTPKTVNEIPKKRLNKQIKLKHKLKGNSNLPPF